MRADGTMVIRMFGISPLPPTESDNLPNPTQTLFYDVSFETAEYLYASLPNPPFDQATQDRFAAEEAAWIGANYPATMTADVSITATFDGAYYIPTPEPSVGLTAMLLLALDS